MTVSSISPASIALATTADSEQVRRNFGKTRPRDTAPSSWPARPTRWSPRATDLGDSIWMTRSTAPMSMPSSSDEVATRHGISPFFSELLDLEPLLPRDRAVVRPGNLPSRRARSVAARALGKAPIVDEHDRGAVLLHELEHLGIDRRPDRIAGRVGADAEAGLVSVCSG